MTTIPDSLRNQASCLPAVTFNTFSPKPETPARQLFTIIVSSLPFKRFESTAKAKAFLVVTQLHRRGISSPNVTKARGKWDSHRHARHREPALSFCRRRRCSLARESGGTAQRAAHLENRASGCSSGADSCGGAVAATRRAARPLRLQCALTLAPPLSAAALVAAKRRWRRLARRGQRLVRRWRWRRSGLRAGRGRGGERSGVGARQAACGRAVYVRKRVRAEHGEGVSDGVQKHVLGAQPVSAVVVVPGQLAKELSQFEAALDVMRGHLQKRQPLGSS
eukprot:6176705-Pleurochrysis_carterae.AAC.2